MIERRIEIASDGLLVSGGSSPPDRAEPLDHPVTAREQAPVPCPPRSRSSDPLAADPVRSGGSGLSVDERSALYLLSMARALLKRDHPGVAAMIDYAMLDVAVGQPD